jgi:hypothetical protein
VLKEYLRMLVSLFFGLFAHIEAIFAPSDGFEPAVIKLKFKNQWRFKTA